MNTKKTDYQERKDTVLGIVVNEYIKTINPVSSGFIAQGYLLDISPATIRNILAELEEDGYLAHPHTSAGKVPTQLGYRYYVDHLMHEIQLLSEEKEQIKAAYQKEIKNLEILLEKTSQFISDFTQYTSIISVDGWEGKIFCKGTGYVVGYPELQDLNKIKDILRALEEKENILSIINRDLERKINIFIGHELPYSQIDNCSLAVSRYQSEHGPSGRIALLGPTCMNYGRVVSTLDYFSKLMGEVL